MKEKVFLKKAKKTIKSGYYISDLMREYLTSNGYEYLGSGVDQTAFREKSTGMCLKIATDYSSISTVRKYIDFCEKTNSKYLPKFFGMKDINIEGEYVGLQYRSELLERKWNEVGFICSFTSRLMEGVSYGRIKTAKEVKEKVKKSIRGSSIIHLIDDAEEYANTVFRVGLFAKKNKYRIDLHTGNMMFRGNTPVINDPVVDN